MSCTVPCVPRAVMTLGLAGVALLGTVVIAGCGTHRAATGFCATIQRGHAAFDSNDAANASRALSEFDRVAASAPAPVAPDLKTVSTVLRDPAVLARDPALIRRYFAAIGRVDRYLHTTCAINVPPVSKVF